MKIYIILAKVNEITYLTKICAESESSAEHAVLDLSVCGMHTYGVTACMAFDTAAMKTDTFIHNAIDAQPISFEALKEKIEKRNAEILKRDEAERRIESIEKEMTRLQQQLNEAKAILNN